MKKAILITGGAGFIGSAVIRHILNNSNFKIINIDKLTYASNLSLLKKYEKNKNYVFEKIDICNQKKMVSIFKKYKPQLVMHLAAETHVDRSINSANSFIKTNILGTYNLLEVSKEFLKANEGDTINKNNNLHYAHIKFYRKALIKNLYQKENFLIKAIMYLASRLDLVFNVKSLFPNLI